MRQQNRTSITFLLVALGLFVGLLLGWLLQRNADRQTDGLVSWGSSSKLDQIWHTIQRQYVDNIDDSIADRMYAAMVASLDPHSNYVTAEEMRRESTSLKGQFGGVGMALRMMNDTVRIGQVYADQPADKAGLHPSDCLLAVNDTTVSGVKRTLDDVVSMVRGPRGSKVKLTVLRPGAKKTMNVEVRRATIQIPSVVYKGMLDRTTGYIKVVQFDAHTDAEFRDAIRLLRKKGMQRLVVDLRNNAGGLLSAAVNVCDELLPHNELIVYTQGVHQARHDIRSKAGGLFSKGDVMVLIDEFSASASEIVAGAIQDNDRGVVVGRRSFGKGLVQQFYNLSDGSALRLTTSRYYTPSGRCIQRPYDKGTDEYYEDFISQLYAGLDDDSLVTAVTDSTPYYTQNGRVVYGGGGILPDHVLTFSGDTNRYYFNRMANAGVFAGYAMELTARRGATWIERYTNADDFVARYQPTDADMEGLYAYGVKMGVPRNATSIARYNKEMRSLLKAHIGDLLYGAETFYKVHLWADEELQQALKFF